jgi:hypothetical protein
MNTPSIALGHELRAQEVAVKDVDMNEGRVPPVREGRRDP